METLNNLTIGWLFAIIVAIGGVIAAVKAIDEPFKKRREMIDEHEKEIRELNLSMSEQHEMLKTILRTQSAMINHMIDGNGIDGLKQVRNELQKAIIK